jgi:hypothetical protein
MDAETRAALRALVEQEARRRAYAPGVLRERVELEHVRRDVLAESRQELAERQELARRAAVVELAELPRCAGRVYLGSRLPGPRCSRRARYRVGDLALCGTHRRIELHGRGAAAAAAAA